MALSTINTADLELCESGSGSSSKHKFSMFSQQSGRKNSLNSNNSNNNKETKNSKTLNSELDKTNEMNKKKDINMTEEESEEMKETPSIIFAGPTNPLTILTSNKTSKSTRFDEEKLELVCDWKDCSFKTYYLHDFSDHVISHIEIPIFCIQKSENKAQNPDSNIDIIDVLFMCLWDGCSSSISCLNQLQKHMYFHVYHTKLKCLGQNLIDRHSEPLICQTENEFKNTVPDIGNLICAWDTCSDEFTNIQEYLDHIRYHCLTMPKGHSVKGGIKCLWKNCKHNVSNVTKLREHVRSHTCEKVVACPKCGRLFSNRTRLIDHCHRQVESKNYGCDVCFKTFHTARVLTDHIRSHVNNYKCNECEMSCISPSGLETHIRFRHSKITPFPCHLCDYAAKASGDLTKHLLKHEQGLYFHCETEDCNYKCKSEKLLESHRAKKHTGSPHSIYACHLCEQHYTRGYSLTRHLINVHDAKSPFGLTRFSYKPDSDGLFRLNMIRYESEDVKDVTLLEMDTESSS